jgi:hypothetical protein
MKWIRGMATSRSFFRNMKLNQKMLWLKSDRGQPKEQAEVQLSETEFETEIEDPNEAPVEVYK